MIFFILISIIYIFIYYVLILIYNFILDDYLYPYLLFNFDRCINYFYQLFINYDFYYETHNDIINNIYSHHYNNKNNININKLFKNKNLHLLSILTCPICFNFYDKIFICNNGHSICNKCFSNSNVCGFCRSHINFNTRNRLLEDLLCKMKLPCSYYNFGCKKLFFNQFRLKHEKNCRFKPMICHFDNCIFNSSFNNLLSHINTSHDFNNVFTFKLDDFCSFDFIFDISKFIDFNNIFNNKKVFNIINFDNNLIFIKYFIQKNNLKLNDIDFNDQNNIISRDTFNNYALCFSLLGCKFNKFCINIYSINNNSKFGKYTLFNRINSFINFNNTICIPLSCIFAIKKFSFKIDITIYKNKRKNTISIK